MTARRVAKLLLIAGFLLVGWRIRGTEAKKGCAKYEVMESGELPCEIKQEIVEVHNKYRQKVAKGLVKGQPRASNMREMYWDDELAKGAQDWANQCEFEHNPGHERKVVRFDVGQNLGISRSIGRRDNEMRAEFSKHIKAWFDENEQFNFAPISGAGNTGHYTQVIWADTYLVGCGYVRYKEGATTSQFYVCNYGPAGNMLTKQPYEVGKQKCENELVKSKTYRGLCALKEPPSFKCSSKGKSARRLLSGRKKKSHARKKCKGSECLARRAMSKFENMEVNDTDSNMKKVYNLITINVFH